MSALSDLRLPATPRLGALRGLLVPARADRPFGAGPWGQVVRSRRGGAAVIALSDLRLPATPRLGALRGLLVPARADRPFGAGPREEVVRDRRGGAAVSALSDLRLPATPRLGVLLVPARAGGGSFEQVLGDRSSGAGEEERP